VEAKPQLHHAVGHDHRPSFSDEDELSRHPLVVRKRLEGLSLFQQRQFERWVRELCFASSIERSDLSQGVPAFAAIRSAAALVKVDRLKSGGASVEDQLLAQEKARLAAEAQASDSLALAVQEEELRRSAEQERDQYRGQAMALVARVEALESRLSSLGGSGELGERPTSFDSVAEWVMTNFAGKLVLAPRATRGLKAAEYESVEAVCSGIALLATLYRDVLLGRGVKEQFDSAIAAEGFNLSGSIAESRAGEFGDEYFVKYRNVRRFLHGHLQKGNSYEPRYCLRIYFFWHEEESQIVVGWLPSHLTNRFS
jgi:hypothetical protein